MFGRVGEKKQIRTIFVLRIISRTKLLKIILRKLQDLVCVRHVDIALWQERMIILSYRWSINAAAMKVSTRRKAEHEISLLSRQESSSNPKFHTLPNPL